MAQLKREGETVTLITDMESLNTYFECCRNWKDEVDPYGWACLHCPFQKLCKSEE